MLGEHSGNGSAMLEEDLDDKQPVEQVNKFYGIINSYA
jgi:hypothetical protein